MRTIHEVVDRVLVTEKGTRKAAEENNQFQLRVRRDANKLEIKRAVEGLFNVHVVKVNTMVVAGKNKRTRTMQAGRTQDWKRAIVTLKEGERIHLQ